MRLVICSILILADFALAQAQYTDTISVMHYNILNYRNHYNECNDTTNNTENKENKLSKIIAYKDADILTFNEIAADPNSFDSLYLNLNLTNEYEMAEYSGSGFLANALFYKRSKLRYYTRDSISKDLNGAPLVRQIDLHILYHNNSNALQDGDTTFIAVYIAHYKAGSSLDDLQQREKMSAALMNYHNAHYRAINYLLCGDFNMRSSAEEAFQLLVNPNNSSIRFNDPIDQVGAWNSNSTFSEIHTQSTRSSETNNNCFSAGGLDDRFDFILVGDEILDNSRQVEFLRGSYEAVGNDGAHFNKDIKSPANTAVPLEILEALYEVSDHLPVYLRLVVSSTYSGIDDKQMEVFTSNPISYQLIISVRARFIKSINVYNSFGELVHSYVDIEVAGSPITLDCSNLSNGFYIVEIKIGDEIVRKKVIVNKS